MDQRNYKIAKEYTESFKGEDKDFLIEECFKNLDLKYNQRDIDIVKDLLDEDQ